MNTVLSVFILIVIFACLAAGWPVNAAIFLVAFCADDIVTFIGRRLLRLL